MIQVRALAVVLLAGCTVGNLPSEQQITASNPPARAAPHAPRVGAKTVAVAQHPLNCGTPDEYKICPLPLREVITAVELADLSPLPQGARVEIEQLDIPPPLPPLTPAQLAQALPPIPEPPKAPLIVVPPPPTPIVLDETLVRLRNQ